MSEDFDRNHSSITQQQGEKMNKYQSWTWSDFEAKVRKDHPEWVRGGLLARAIAAIRKETGHLEVHAAYPGGVSGHTIRNYPPHVVGASIPQLRENDPRAYPTTWLRTPNLGKKGYECLCNVLTEYKLLD